MVYCVSTAKKYLFFHRFDMLFIMRACVELDIQCEPLASGTGLYSLFLPSYGIYFTDCYRMLQMPLKKFHKRFNLRNQKGHYPFKFLNEKTLNYIGPMPSLDLFISCNDAPEDIQEKEDYWNEVKSDIYVNSTSLMEYCERDCLVTLSGMLSFTLQTTEIQEKLKKIFTNAPEEPNTLSLLFPFVPPRMTTLGSIR